MKVYAKLMGRSLGKPLPQLRQFIDNENTVLRCPLCDREVDVFKHPDLGAVLLGHRTEMSHTPETPWCQGGGRQQIDAALEVMEIAPLSPGGRDGGQ